jgi:hypothetical protein
VATDATDRGRAGPHQKQQVGRRDSCGEALAPHPGEAPVILFNVVEGISLHEGEANNGGNNVPRSQIDHDLRWSAIQAHQIDGRSHRDGKFAQVYWVVAKDTVDCRVAEVLLRKLESMGNVQVLRPLLLPWRPSKLKSALRIHVIGKKYSMPKVRFQRRSCFYHCW